jgi:hypothetical protein
MSNYEQQQGALERLGIPVQTTPPEEIMTSGQARSVRFRVSRPQGYAFGDIESFIFERVQPTLDYYADVLHQRDLAVHKLGEVIDTLEVNVMNLQAQLDNKQYNEAIGLAVDEVEKDDETDVLIGRIHQLEEELKAVQRDQATVASAPVQSPEGEYYSREEVEGFIATAVAEAEAAKEAEIASRGYYTSEEVEKILADASQNAGVYTQEQADALIAEAVSNIPVAPAVSDDTYTHEEVEEFIATAVAEAEAAKEAEKAAAVAAVEAAKTAEKNAAVAEVEATKTAEKNKAVAAVEAATASAVAAAEQKARTEAEAAHTGYTEEELTAAVAEAVQEAEQRILNSLPEDSKPLDEIDELTNEGDLKLRAEVKTLSSAVAQQDAYIKDLENYVAQIEGRPQAEAVPESATGRPLPQIRPEDL